MSLDHINKNKRHRLIKGFFLGKKALQQTVPIFNYDIYETSLSASVSTCSTISLEQLKSKHSINIPFQLDPFSIEWASLKQIYSNCSIPLPNMYHEFSQEEKTYWNASVRLQQFALDVMNCEQLEAANFINSIEQLPYYQEYHLKDSYCEVTASSLVSFALLVSKFERFLGDVHFTIVNGSKKTPLILRDLLDSTELVDFFGSEVIFFLKCMIGPPSGMNLRNLVWHGFICPQEFHNSYVPCLLLIFAVLLNFVHSRLKLQQRKLILYDQITPKSFDFGLGDYLFEHKLSLREVDWIYHLISHSYFIIPTRRQILKQSILYYIHGKDIMFIASLLPQIEHSLRRIYVAVNGLPSKYLCAEAREYYTTIEILLSPLLLDENTENMIYKELGPNLIHALNDMLISPKGPRIRDRVSHGECSFSIPSIISDRLLGLFICLCHKYQPFELSIPTRIHHCIEFYNAYVPCFHQISLIQRDIWHIGSLIRDLDFIISKPIFDKEFTNRVDDISAYQRTENIHQKLFSYVKSQKLALLFQLEKDIIVDFREYLFNTSTPSNKACISVLSKIVGGILNFMKGLFEKYQSQYEDIESSSATIRLKNSFYKLLGCLDTYRAISCTIILFALCEISYWYTDYKLLYKVQGLIEKLNHQIQSNQWLLMIQTIRNLLELLQAVPILNNET